MITRLRSEWRYGELPDRFGHFHVLRLRLVDVKVNGKFMCIGKFNDNVEAERLRKIVRKIREPKYHENNVRRRRAR